MQSVEEILGKLETADNTTKNRIENILVDKGKSVVPELSLIHISEPTRP